jgi:protein-L-isoaspartate(D-aspartate) O-methyltransferase
MGMWKRRTIIVISALVAFAAFLLLLWAVRGWTIQGPGGGNEVASPTILAVAPSPSSAAQEDEYTEKRERLVSILKEFRGIRDREVLQAMGTVPRHEFVPAEYVDQAYDADHPLPIGYGQTISAADIVAMMTELLELERGHRVLEIGTGSGYQAAILAELTEEVYTVEIIPELAESANERLKRLGYENIRTLHADGYYGWEEHAPYDRIIVTAAPDHVPQPLIEQLKEGGRLVIPVGPPGWLQTLWLVTKEGGEPQFHNIMGVAFVPLTGEH